MNGVSSRLQQHPGFARMLRSEPLSAARLILPLFVVDGSGVRKPIVSLPGQSHWSADTVGEACKQVADAGIPAVLLFGQSADKDAFGSGAWAESGAVQRAIAAIKKAVPDLLVMTDVCLCAYTAHGHCRVLQTHAKDPSQWQPQPTLDALGKIALSHAQAGADLVAPSDKNPGNIGAVRRALDGNGFASLPILAYTLKYASAFYGPFRDAVDSSPAFGDRSSYQLDTARPHDVLTLVKSDLDQGADAILVKPALPYLDVLAQAKQAFNVPMAAYQVSGEFAMIKAAAARGALDEKRAMIELFRSMHRAGADWIISYWALDAAQALAVR